MKQTTQFGLNQWEQTDRILMEDFNRDNAKVEAALAGQAAAMAAVEQTLATRGNCGVYFTTYAGSGTVSRSFSFPAPPLAVIITGGDRDNLIFSRGQTAAVSHRGSGHGDVKISWSGSSCTLSSINGAYICNDSERTFFLTAIYQM